MNLRRICLIAICFSQLSCDRDVDKSVVVDDADLRVINANLFQGRALIKSDDYVIVGSDGSVLHSEDGRRWTAGDTGFVSEAFFDFAENPGSGLLIAVGEKGRSVRSLDGGKRWEILNTGTSAALRRIAYSKFSNCWLTVGDESAVLQSCDDGRTWATLAAGLPAQSFTAVASIENRHELLIGGEQGLWRSTDQGLSWVQVDGSQSHQITHIAFLPDSDLLFVLSSDSVVLRREKERWTVVTLDIDSVYLSGLASNGEILLVSGSAGSVYFSTDGGISWRVQFVADSYFTNVQWLLKSQQFVLTGNNGALFIANAQLENWLQLKLRNEGNIEGVLPLNDGDSLVLMGEGGSLALLTEKNKIQILREDLSGFVQAMQWLPSGRLVVSGSTGILRYSDNAGLSWQRARADISENDYLLSLAFLPRSRVLLAAGPPGVILRSEDNGVSWQTVLRTDSADDGYFHKIIADPQREWVLAIAGPGRVRFSTDAGLTWVAADADTTQHLFNVAQNPLKGTYIAVGREGVVQRSEDGLHWQKQILDKNLNIQGVTFHPGSGLWFVAGQNGSLWGSEDNGFTWLPITADLGADLFHVVVVDEQHIIACGAKGLLLLSRDAGTSWQQIDVGITGTLREPYISEKGIVLIPTRDGHLLKSLDFGETWWPLRTRTTESLKVVSLMPGGSKVVAAGNRIVQITPEPP